MRRINPFYLIKKHGYRGTVAKVWEVFAGKPLREAKFKYYKFKFRNVNEYQNPTVDELAEIENELKRNGIELHEIIVDKRAFDKFKNSMSFPADYHGGLNSGYWEEKLLEHYLAYELLQIDEFKDDDVYIDVAACGSPWAKILREKMRINAYAIDLEVYGAYKSLDYYLCQDATKTSFAPSSVKGVSLHCAFEMFVGDDDIYLVKELGRILKPGGKAVIVPLYMHTHYCSYATPEYWGKGISDREAVEYIKREGRCIPSSRKYSAAKLQERILRHIDESKMTYKIHVLNNKHQVSPEIYCHFILEITR